MAFREGDDSLRNGGGWERARRMLRAPWARFHARRLRESSDSCALGASIDYFGKHRDPRGLEPLTALPKRCRDASLVLRACHALAAYGSGQAGRALEALLGSVQGVERMRMLSALAGSGSPVVKPAILMMLSEDEWHVRVSALAAFAPLADSPRDLGMVFDMLGDPSPAVAISAKEVLAGKCREGAGMAQLVIEMCRAGLEGKPRDALALSLIEIKRKAAEILGKSDTGVEGAIDA